MTVKPITFLGDSLDELRTFPEEVRREAGHQLDRVQRGLDPADWKPMPKIGPGVREIRLRDAAGAFRVIYTAILADAVYVLHAFLTKAQRTAENGISELGQLRLTCGNAGLPQASQRRPRSRGP